MIDDFISETPATTSLVPAPHAPDAALAESGWRPFLESERAIARRGTLRDVLESALDTLDTLGDTIAGAVGLR